MIYQKGDIGPLRRMKTGQEDIPGAHNAVLLIQVTGLCIGQRKSGGPIKQRHVYAARVGRFEVNSAIVQLFKGG